MRPANSIFRTIALGLSLLLAATHSNPALAAQLQAPRAVEWKEFLGVNAHFLWFSPEQYQAQMQSLKALGLQWVRVDLHWDRHEPTEGHYRLGELDEVVESMGQQQLKSVLYLVGSAPHITSAPPDSPVPDQYPPRDPSIYAQYIAMLAQRYPGVSAWQIWNEPNIPAFWRPAEDAQSYARLLHASVNALRMAVPDKPVVIGGMAYYSQMPVKGGLMLQALGQYGVQTLGAIAAYHPYSEQPESDEPYKNDFIAHGQQLNQMLRDASVPAIWATEWGWSSYTGAKERQSIIGEEGQADYVLRRLAIMSAMDYDKVFLFALSDLDQRATERDQHYGLLDLQGNPKPVYRALQRFLQVTGPRLEPAQAPRLQHQPSDLYSVSWKRSDGKHLWLFWSASSATVHLPEVTDAQVHDPMTGELNIVQSIGGVRVKATPSLQMLVW